MRKVVSVIGSMLIFFGVGLCLYFGTTLWRGTTDEFCMVTYTERDGTYRCKTGRVCEKYNNGYCDRWKTVYGSCPKWEVRMILIYENELETEECKGSYTFKENTPESMDVPSVDDKISCVRVVSDLGCEIAKTSAGANVTSIILILVGFILFIILTLIIRIVWNKSKKVRVASYPRHLYENQPQQPKPIFRQVSDKFHK